MSNAIIGTGVLLKAGDGGGPEVFVAIAEIVSLKPPQFSRNEIDVSNHNEGQESKILGMLRKGQVTGTLNWLPLDATHSATGVGMLANILANTKRNWQIAFPPASSPVFTFAARVQLFDIQEITVDAAMQVNYALTIDGLITIT